MLNAFYLLIVIPFILGFVTYGILGIVTIVQNYIRKYAQSPNVRDPSISIQVSPEIMATLQENDYIDPTSGRLKGKALEQLEFKIEM